jgi:hypothetical protein
MLPPPSFVSSFAQDGASSTAVAAAIASMTSTAPGGVDFVAPTSTITTTMVTVAAAVAAATTKPGSTAPDDGVIGHPGECRLLGPFALFVQLALGALALTSLVYKRWRERPQRPLKIWFFDVSKQVLGSLLVHVVNVFMSMLTSGRFSIKLNAATIQTAQRLLRRDDDYTPNPCSFYLLNLAIDVRTRAPYMLA